MDVDIKLQGFDELVRALQGLPDDIARNALRSAVAAGAKIVRDEAKSRINDDTGTLRRSMYMKQIRELSGMTQQTFYIGARQGKKHQKVGKKGLNRDAYYGKFVEFGHWARTSGKGRLARGKGREAAIAAMAASGKIKWVPAHPFLRPAFDVKKGEAIQAIGLKIADRLLRYKFKGK